MDFTEFYYTPTPEEIKRHSDEEHKRLDLNPDAYYQSRFNFVYADLEIRVIYQPWFLPLTFSHKYRVIGRPGETGSILWEEVDADKDFSKVPSGAQVTP